MTFWNAVVGGLGLPAFGIALFLAQEIVHEIGYRLGRRARPGDQQTEGIGVIVGAMLGLLGFVLALTLSFASARFNERRDATIAEANAIGTAWLRAQAISHPRGADIAGLVEEYAKARTAFILAPAGDPALEEISRRVSDLQTKLWAQVTTIVRERPDPVSASLMVSMNDVFDMTAKERFAYAFPLPPQLIWLLLGMVLIAMAGLGYQLGRRGLLPRVMISLLIATWTVVVMVIIDLGTARTGAFRTSAAAYEATLASFRSSAAAVR